MKHRLKKEVKDIIRKNNKLAYEICELTDMQTHSLAPAMHRNTTVLLTLPVLDIIQRHTGIVDAHELYEEIVSTDHTQNNAAILI